MFGIVHGHPSLMAGPHFSGFCDTEHKTRTLKRHHSFRVLKFESCDFSAAAAAAAACSSGKSLVKITCSCNVYFFIMLHRNYKLYKL